MLVNSTRTSGLRSSAFARFFRSEASGSILLLLCTVVALTWSNSPWSSSYFRLLHTTIGITWRDSNFTLSWSHWIDDGLMALFFFVVGLEIKREIVVGELSTIKRAILPVAGAVGGMILPALIFTAVNFGKEGAHGWGIPMATDIAFSLGIIALLGSRIPAGLKVFVAALAIADDLGSVLVIALFYTDHISILALMAAGGFLGLLVLALRLRVATVGVCAVLVAGVWIAIHFSGIHATVAGVLVAMVVPVRSRIQPGHFFAIARERLDQLEAGGLSGPHPKIAAEHIEVLRELNQATSDVVPAGLALERYLHPVTAYLVLPLFALFNAGIAINYGIVSALAHPIGMGVLCGLIFGKQIGVLAASWLVVRLHLADLPANVSWRQIHAASVLAGIGFTMSLFIAELAIPEDRLRGFAKIGILGGSAICAAAGYLLLRAGSGRPAAIIKN